MLADMAEWGTLYQEYRAVLPGAPARSERGWRDGAGDGRPDRARVHGPGRTSPTARAGSRDGRDRL